MLWHRKLAKFGTIGENLTQWKVIKAFCLLLVVVINGAYLNYYRRSEKSSTRRFLGILVPQSIYRFLDESSNSQLKPIVSDVPPVFVYLRFVQAGLAIVALFS